MKRIPLKYVFVIGVGLLLFGFALFLRSLGGGGGFLAISLMLLGAIGIVSSLIVVVVRSITSKKAERD